MKTTYLIVAIEHENPLPEKLMTASDVVCQRLYQWGHAGGVAVDVRATRLSPSAVQAHDWEQSDGQPA